MNGSPEATPTSPNPGGAARAWALLQKEKLADALSTPEGFKRWVSAADMEEFTHFISGVNYTLRNHVIVDEPAEYRGFKREANVMADEGPGGSIIVVRTTPGTEEVHTLFREVHEAYKARIAVDQFEEAAHLLYESIVLLQPFSNGNKRTARACFYATLYAGDSQHPLVGDVEALIARDFSSFEEKDTHLADLEASVFKRYDANVSALIRSDAVRSWGERKLVDSAEMGPAVSWGADEDLIERSVETLGRIIDVYDGDITIGQADDLLFSVNMAIRMRTRDVAVRPDEHVIQPAVYAAARAVRECAPEEPRLNNFIEDNHGDVVVHVESLMRFIVGNLHEPACATAFRIFLDTLKEVRVKAAEQTLSIHGHGGAV